MKTRRLVIVLAALLEVSAHASAAASMGARDLAERVVSAAIATCVAQAPTTGSACHQDRAGYLCAMRETGAEAAKMAVPAKYRRDFDSLIENTIADEAHWAATERWCDEGAEGDPR